MWEVGEDVRYVKKGHLHIRHEVNDVLGVHVVAARRLPQHVMRVEVTSDEGEGREVVGLDECFGPFMGVWMAVDVKEETFSVSKHEREAKKVRVGNDVMPCARISSSPAVVDVTCHSGVVDVTYFK